MIENGIFRLEKMALGCRFLPERAKAWFAGKTGAIWLKRVHKIADDAAELCACSGWRGFVGRDQSGRFWTITGTKERTGEAGKPRRAPHAQRLEVGQPWPPKDCGDEAAGAEVPDACSFPQGRAWAETFQALRDLQRMAHREAVAAGWYKDPQTGERIQRNVGEMLALIHSEVSETLEGVRKGQPDKHLPHRSSEEVELADTVIRILDYAGHRGLDLSGAVREKIAYNQRRADHKPEARAAAGGKAF